MAWQLPTEVYQLPVSRLYVTYFGGDKALGLQPDLEVRDIWRALGVSEERILPFGLKDNFWEMGDVGPCGPCTEIHYDHLDRPIAADRVNLGVEDMIELWNIVFIHYERVEGGELRDLGHSFVDTGMGLERITAVLNGTTSNYGTDLFTPLFSTIHKLSGRPEYRGGFSKDGRCLDTAYRTLADHARMVTVALADGAFPRECYVLYKILRRALSISCKHFDLRQGAGLGELAGVVAETLASAHPEVLINMPTVTSVIAHEEKNYYTTRENLHQDWMELLRKRPELAAMSDYTSTRIIEGVEEILPHIETWRNSDRKLPGAVAFKLYNTYGIHPDLIHDLAGVYDLKVDVEEFLQVCEKYKSDGKKKIRMKSVKNMVMTEEKLIDSLQKSGVPFTNDSAKYVYESKSGNYQFPHIRTKVVALLKDGELVEKVSGEAKVGVILEATNFYHEAGGQVTDTGKLCTDLAEVEVERVENVGGYLIHWGQLRDGQLTTENRVVASVCEERRLGCMQHHTATHLLNTAIKSVVGVSRQTSSHVTPKDCLLQLQTYQTLDTDIIQRAQDLVQKWIAAKSPIDRKTIPFQELLQESNAVMIPGEVYPHTVHVIATSMKDAEAGHLSSLEPCCGTHLHNTAHLNAFIVENVSTIGQNFTNIRALCGEAAAKAEANAIVALQMLQLLQTVADDDKDRLLSLDKEIHVWWENNKNQPLPYTVRNKIKDALEDLSMLRKKNIRVNANAEMRNEVQQVIDNQRDGPIVHLVKTEFGSSRPRLLQAHKLARDRAMLLLVRTGDVVVGRSALPKHVFEKGASASDWLDCVREVLGGNIETPHNKDSHLVSNYRSFKLQDISEDRLRKALHASKNYIDKFF